jgi:hypothetical protein
LTNEYTSLVLKQPRNYSKDIEGMIQAYAYTVPGNGSIKINHINSHIGPMQDSKGFQSAMI